MASRPRPFQLKTFSTTSLLHQIPNTTPMMVTTLIMAGRSAWRNHDERLGKTLGARRSDEIFG